MSRLHLAPAALFACALSSLSTAQTPPATPPAPAEPGKAPAAAAAPASAPAAGNSGNRLDRVEVSSGPTANSRRRNSTASKIVIEREDLEKYGDVVLGDVLRRLPGVTLGGRPGRGGDIRMRGMAGTRITIDDESPPPGFAVEDLPPDQIERIEIYRAPTAATGTRSNAGTINIVLREPLQKSNHEVRVGLGWDRNEPQFDASWTRNLKGGGPNGDEFVGAISTNAAVRRFFNNVDSGNRITDTETGQVVEQNTQLGTSENQNTSVNGNGRLRWKYSDTLSFNVNPFFVFSQNEGSNQFNSEGTRFRDVHGDNDARNHSLRLSLSADYRPKMGESFTVRMGAGTSKNTRNSQRRDTMSIGGVTTERLQQDHNAVEEDQASLSGRWNLKTAQEHQWVSGLETERSQRTQVADTLVNGAPLPGLARFGNTLSTRNERFAAFTQDEWSPNKQWALYAGIRYERIATTAAASGALPETRNVSQVTSPLFHILWKPEAFPKDQVRLGLTRSYRPPNLNNLVARPVINTTYPEGPNYQTHADRAGNPDLKPELSTNVDLSLEHWLPTGGIISGTAFWKDINNLSRNQVMLETVSWDTAQRWVSRPRNMGTARMMGLEFEFKARMDELWEDAPAELQMMLLRFNAAVFKNKVQGFPGNSNRVGDQPRGSFNLGLDHRWKAWGLNFGSGFNMNYVPATREQVTETLRRDITARRQFDAYLSWSSGAVRDGINWRLSMANLMPRDAEDRSEGISINSVTQHEYLTESWSRNKTFRVISLRADMRF
ncbi:TonB-dependent receptor domain-containing protein [Roseateles asaccharophilus]|uniref:Iron complex outermembrane receptor protein n=1 Tax=Roseateles asaccharophilus TaxID=582607 RepID=A0ABU2A6G7_9BURK|nr:TonB-dependent receptor [Roseateles asaccharophilus]MDR7332600.1 iron complex outermembrane receptor protein [Roseateles asaccharophilus]